ncbi:hypothetical protein L7F22_054063 [Adiantum nelumboides]|nr:hypothetical protein [Adiantum nelumboides]
MESGPQLACRASKHAVEVYRLSELAQKKRPSHLTHLHRRQVNRKRVFQCHGQILVCKACGRTKLESGCNGEGRIQCGIGALPGFDWWPIKAYRPCPAFIQSGGQYRRSGQSLNELAFGQKTSRYDLNVFERLNVR